MALTAKGHSTPLSINVLDSLYTTVVSTTSWTMTGGTTNDTRTMTSAVPLSDSMYNGISGQLEAQADISPFQISAFTAADGANDPLRLSSSASADSEIWFTPTTSQSTTINIQFSGWSQWYYSEGSVSLLDVTSGDTIWNYGWSYFPVKGTVPWVAAGGSSDETAALSIDTGFIASDTYQLIMHTDTTSNPPDVEHILIQLSGLEPVPEPSVFVLLGLGSLGLAAARRRG